MTTPERQKAEQLLAWMRTNLPAVKGETSSVVSRRRRAVKTLLRGLSVTDNGCLVYGDVDGRKDPQFHWPMFEPPPKTRSDFDTSKCQWPGGCEFPRRHRGSTGKYRYYCHREVEGVKHDSSNARLYEDGKKRLPARVGYYSRAAKLVYVHRLVIELWFPKLPVPKALTTTCKVGRCVNPQHRVSHYANLAEFGRVTQFKSHLSDEVIREIVYRRLNGESSASLAAEFGSSPESVRAMAKGVACARVTKDIREAYAWRARKLTHDDARSLVQARIDSPWMTYAELGEKFGISKNSVRDICSGKAHGAYTKDLIAKLPPRKHGGRRNLRRPDGD